MFSFQIQRACIGSVVMKPTKTAAIEKVDPHNRRKQHRHDTTAHFQTVKKILHTLGLYDITDSYTAVNYVKYMIIVLFLFATFLTSFHFVVFISSDMQKTSTALFAANIMLISSIYFTMLFGQKTALRQLLDHIEAVARTRNFFQVLVC